MLTIASDDTETVGIDSHSFRQRYLFAFAPRGEVLGHIRTQASTGDVERLEHYLARWESAQQSVAAKLQGEIGHADVTECFPLPPDAAAIAHQYVQSPQFQRGFNALPTSVGTIEIDKLVASQRSVNLDYVDQLKTRLEGHLSMDDLVHLCLDPQRSHDSIHHLEIQAGVHVFSSRSSDLRALGSFVRRDLEVQETAQALNGGVPVAAIVSYVGFGVSTINAFQVGGRVVLNNGFHRLYALRELGVTHAPMIIQHVSNPVLEFPPIVANLPREYLLGAQRPVLLSDFFVPEFAITINAKERMQTVVILPQVNAHPVAV